MTAVVITQVRSANGTNQSQRATLRSLGLGKIGQTVERPDSPQLRGMLNKILHLVQATERT